MSAPDPIPVRIGDDWSFAFTLREAAVGSTPGALVDLTAAGIVGGFYPTYGPTYVPLLPVVSA